MKLTTITELSQFTGKTWRTVSNRITSAGLKPVRHNGKSALYASPAALDAIYLPDLPAAEIDQRQRLAAAQAERVENENAVRRGDLADMREVSRFWEDCMANMRAKLLALPSKLSPRLVNIGDAGVINAAIRADVYAVLSELAEYEPADQASATTNDETR